MGGGPTKSDLVSLLVSLIVLLTINLNGVKSELTPPYFNLAEGRKIQASATCGDNSDGPELYCKLVGANTENDNQYYSVIQGQVRSKNFIFQ
jgi:laminin, alpha 3/5